MTMMVCQTYRASGANPTGWYRPTVATFSGTASYSSSANDANAYDTGTTAAIDTATSADLQANGRPRASVGSSTAQMIYTGFGAVSANGYIHVKISGTTQSNTSIDLSNVSDSQIQVDYALDWNGTTGTWVSLGGINAGSSWSLQDLASIYRSGVNLSTLAVRVTCTGDGVGTTVSDHAQSTATASIFDVVFSPNP